MNESQIESAKSVHELMDLLNNCTRSIFDCDALLKVSFFNINICIIIIIIIVVISCYQLFIVV